MMHRFREISETAARKIDRTMMAMAGGETLDDLEIRFIQEAGSILPADCFCWNNWSLDMGHLIDFRINDSYMTPFAERLEVFNEVVAHHPVIASNQLAASADQVMRLSDFEGHRSFRENPLFREVYRHLDSYHQLAYTPCLLEDRRIILTWNRRVLDFTERDRQVFHFMGQRLALICRRTEQRQKLEKSWRALCGFVDVRINAEPASSLTTGDVRLLTELLKSGTRGGIARAQGVRRDSVDKRLGSIRERLGLENHHQLLSALAELKVPVDQGAS